MPEPTDTVRSEEERRAHHLTTSKLPLVAYEFHRDAGLELVPATPNRAWMAASPNRFANRCLPLLIANQAGWFVLNNAPVTVSWTGGPQNDDLVIQYEGAPPVYRAVSHFGQGTLTWNLPFLFRTPPGYNLLVRGPANWIKDAVCPIEGIVETDWSPATFTVNWKLTRPGVSVRFDAGEPICMLVPQRRGELEEFQPEIMDIAVEPETHASYTDWLFSRSRFLRELRFPESQASQVGWQKHYFQGGMPHGPQALTHQTRLRLRRFARGEQA